MKALERESPCKVNLLLNILGKRPDGFHELETIMQPVPVSDRLVFERSGEGIRLSCDQPALPVDSRNLVYRAAEAFLKAAGIEEGVSIHLQKKIPLAAGLGGGSGNAAVTLLGLNQLFDSPLTAAQLSDLAAGLGSDVPFFLQNQPALVTGRGEIIEPLPAFAALRGMSLVLIHPGFGISTAWAYQQLSRFPGALQGAAGRARQLVGLLKKGDLTQAAAHFYNALEGPALLKFPVLALYQKFLRANGAVVALMSGSGSSTFGIVPSETAERVAEALKREFAPHWVATVSLG